MATKKKKKERVWDLKRRVEVSWGDAYGGNTWASNQNITGEDCTPLDCISMGYVLEDTKHGIMLAATQAENNDNSNRLFIPRGMVQKVRTLR